MRKLILLIAAILVLLAAVVAPAGTAIADTHAVTIYVLEARQRGSRLITLNEATFNEEWDDAGESEYKGVISLKSMGLYEKEIRVNNAVYGPGKSIKLNHADFTNVDTINITFVYSTDPPPEPDPPAEDTPAEDPPADNPSPDNPPDNPGDTSADNPDNPQDNPQNPPQNQDNPPDNPADAPEEGNGQNPNNPPEGQQDEQQQHAEDQQDPPAQNDKQENQPAEQQQENSNPVVAEEVPQFVAEDVKDIVEETPTPTPKKKKAEETPAPIKTHTYTIRFVDANGKSEFIEESEFDKNERAVLIIMISTRRGILIALDPASEVTVTYENNIKGDIAYWFEDRQNLYTMRVGKDADVYSVDFGKESEIYIFGNNTELAKILDELAKNK